MKGRAHVGGHVTLLFSIQDDADSLLEQGSRGAGISLDRGVIIEASCAHFVHLLQPSQHDGFPQVTAWLCIIQVT